MISLIEKACSSVDKPGRVWYTNLGVNEARRCRSDVKDPEDL